MLFQKLNDATLSSLGTFHNMQIRAVITENGVFVNISKTTHAINMNKVSIPMFLVVKNKIWLLE